MKRIFKNKNVLIMGLGLHGGGVGAAKFFCKQKAKVLITDLKTKEQLTESIKKLKGLPVNYALGGHKENDFINADLIIKNPDVPGSSPYLEIARKNNVEIETDVSLFFKLSDAFIIGVTGTKGKSTTASLIFHLLKPKYLPAGRQDKRLFLAGNIGVSPLELLPKIKKGDKVILELSSFELEDLSQSPNIAVITNILPDHLNRYASMAEYINSKKPIFKYQDKNDVVILNKDDSIVRQIADEAKSKVYVFSADSVDMAGLKIFGEHNKANIAAAVEVAKIMEIPGDVINKALKTFKGVPSRQEFVREVGGVKYFNDTTATIPEAVIAVINSLSERFSNAEVFLICGGVYKGVDYKKFSEKVRQKNVTLILLPGSASDKIKESLSGYQKINETPSMLEAVRKAKELAKRGDVVALSPAASSFNMFKNEFDRGEQFVKAVKSLK
ncbi:MAG: UDP-N-acetylmuramoyl-L-alanine--D-glutamate ligase [Candidatus Staskawiczbacteria bacterium]|nr:UDP-N-acetylmuramoyl-L-alanine--D-glutamate ligase [Candidatus Staskawiczbacteria bacterium]